MTDAPTERDAEGAWARLRRRKVVQWGLAYAAGAWALLQGLEYVTSTFDWPRQIQQFASIGLAVGLPVALVVAWYHGDRGQQRVSGAELAILSVLLALGASALWLYGQRDTQAPVSSVPPAAQATSASSADARPSIAVLPFQNRSRLDDDVFFVDGVHDDILTQLSKVSALKVISRTSVEKFRDTQLSTTEIAGQLGVASILEGGVQRAGDRVRINVQLIDAASDAHLWAESYDRELTAANIFAIQSDVAAAIAGALKIALTEGERRRVNAIPTRSVEAWEAYQLGRQRLRKRTSDAIAEAERYFRRAIELDPKFALAHAGLADSLWLQVLYRAASKDAQIAAAEAAAKTAVDLDPNLGEAWTSLANLVSEKGQNDRAAEMFSRAVELNPNDAHTRQWYCAILMDLGRREEALDQAKAAVDLDPLSLMANVYHGAALELLGRYDEAEKAYRRSIEVDPTLARGYADLGFFLAYVRNQFTEAVPLQQRAVDADPGSLFYLMGLGTMYLDLGDMPRAREIGSELLARGPRASFSNGYASYLSLVDGDLGASARFAQVALAGDATNWWAIISLSNVHWAKGNYTAARKLYESTYSDYFAKSLPAIDPSNFHIAMRVVPVLFKAGDDERAGLLLERVATVIGTMPRRRYGIADVQILALRGEKAGALAALRSAERAGWRGPGWRDHRDFDPALASIRDDPEFKAVFADIERDMARQRAELAKRPKDAPLDLGPSG